MTKYFNSAVVRTSYWCTVNFLLRVKKKFLEQTDMFSYIYKKKIMEILFSHNEVTELYSDINFLIAILKIVLHRHY